MCSPYLAVARRALPKFFSPADGSLPSTASCEPREVPGRVSHDFLEAAAEVGLIREPAHERHVDRTDATIEQLAGTGDPQMHLVGMRRLPDEIPEEAEQVEFAHATGLGQFLESHRLVEALLQQVTSTFDLGSSGQKRQGAFFSCSQQPCGLLGQLSEFALAEGGWVSPTHVPGQGL